MSSTTPSYLKWTLFAGVVALLAFFGYRSCEEPTDFDLSVITSGTCHEFTDPEMFELDELGALGWNSPYAYACQSHLDRSKLGLWVVLPLNGRMVDGPAVIDGQKVTYTLKPSSNSGKTVVVCFYEFDSEEESEFIVKVNEPTSTGTTVVVTADKDTEQPISTGGSVPFSGFANARPCLVIFTGGFENGSGAADEVEFTWSSSAVFVAPTMGAGHTPFPTEYSASTRATDPVRTTRVMSRP